MHNYCKAHRTTFETPNALLDGTTATVAMHIYTIPENSLALLSPGRPSCPMRHHGQLTKSDTCERGFSVSETLARGSRNSSSCSSSNRILEVPGQMRLHQTQSLTEASCEICGSQNQRLLSGYFRPQLAPPQIIRMGANQVTLIATKRN